MKANPDHIEAHLRLIANEAARKYGGQFELNAVVPDGDWTTKRFACSEAGIMDGKKWAVRQTNDGKGVFASKNPRKPGWRGAFGKDRDVEIAFNIAADLDSAESAAIIRKNDLPLPYHWVVVTGTTPNTRGHIYYELDEPMRNMDSVGLTTSDAPALVKRGRRKK